MTLTITENMLIIKQARWPKKTFSGVKRKWNAESSAPKQKRILQAVDLCSLPCEYIQ
jgi:hypothetical protein